ncbi:hypothetical protein BGC07_13675 [Piscirickettsia litoralis]|uniref:Uncharacterized protein n=1 Tax=Piscirickettsia litoralis TaxID=1891921 RepID=A0ABX3AC85_9GAMM|nr:hypothetical protein BGC07_13675 [Piscirickettsia litoralis]
MAVSSPEVQEILYRVNEFVEEENYNAAQEYIQANLTIVTSANLTSLEESIYYYYYSVCLFFKERVDEAYEAIEKAVTLHSEIAYYYHNMAIICFKQGKYSDVISLLEQSRSSAIPFYLSSAYLAVIYSFERLWLKSVVCAEEAKQHHIDSKNLVELCLMTSSFKCSNQIKSDLDFSSFCQDDLNIESLYTQFPEAHFHSHTRKEGHDLCVFFACDYSYFLSHCVYSILSINAQRVKTNVHVHLFNDDGFERNEFDKLIKRVEELKYITCTYSFETIHYLDYYMDCPLYTSTMRFCRAYQYMQAYRQSLIIVDCDSLFRVPVNEITSHIHRPIAVLGDEYAPEWERLAAGVVYLKHGEVALNYLRHVSYFIMNNILLGKGLWFLDQIALKFAYEITLQDKPGHYERLEAKMFCDLAYTEQSYIWMVTAKKDEQTKYNHFKNDLKEKYFSIDELLR